MVIIIACSTIINYGIFSLLDTYYFTKDSIDQNILLMVIVISITSMLIFILIPKETAENARRLLESNGDEFENVERTPEQEIMDIYDHELDTDTIK